MKLLTKQKVNSSEAGNFVPLFNVLKNDNNYVACLLLTVHNILKLPCEIIIWHKDCFSTEYFTFVFNLIFLT